MVPSPDTPTLALSPVSEGTEVFEDTEASEASDAGLTSDPVPGETDERSPTFRLTLTNFEGPFDLLLQLITKHELDITEVALSQVTDEFMAYLRQLDHAAELEQTSEFLVVAATLLDLKVAALLPQGELVDAEDVALLEARDLLFARLLQYRAFKGAAEWLAIHVAAERTRHAREVRLEERVRISDPELRWTTSLEDFAAIAVLAFAPRTLPTVGLDHLHAPLVSIREQAAHVVAILRAAQTVTFRQLIAGVDRPGIVVARFLAVLELYRGGAIGFEQLEPLGELTLRWVAEHWDDVGLDALGADYEQ